MSVVQVLRRPLILAVLASVVSGTSGAQGVGGSPGDFVREFQAGLETRDVDRVLELYAEDAVVFTPQGGVLAGRGRIREALAVNLAGGQPPLRLLSANFDGDAERGVLVWVWHVDPIAQEASRRGRRVRSMLYLRKIGNAWRIVAETTQIYTAPPE